MPRASQGSLEEARNISIFFISLLQGSTLNLDFFLLTRPLKEREKIKERKDKRKEMKCLE